MKRIALFTGLALVLSAPAFAQDTSQAMTPEADQSTEAPAPAPMEAPAPSPTPAPAPAMDAPSTNGHSTTVYHGPHRYPMTERGHQPGDPPIIDHRSDSLIVEPTHSTITIQPTG
jgi:uncharacterized membrane protein